VCFLVYYDLFDLIYVTGFPAAWKIFEGHGYFSSNVHAVESPASQFGPRKSFKLNFTVPEVLEFSSGSNFTTSHITDLWAVAF